MLPMLNILPYIALLLALSQARAATVCPTYVVKEGDSIYGIATQFKILPDDLITALRKCKQSTEVLQIGQQICLPGGELPGCANVIPYNDNDRCKVYVAQQGDTLASVAESLNIYIVEMQNLNVDVEPDELKPNTYLKLPPWDQSCASPCCAGTSCRVYVVRSGDFLAGIAAAFQVDVNDLLAVNPALTADSVLQNGQPVKIPPFPSTCGAGTPTLPPIDTVLKCRGYKVQKGDSLYSIAKAFKTTASELLSVNPSFGNGTLIKIGDMVRIPPYDNSCTEPNLVPLPGTFTPSPPSGPSPSSPQVYQLIAGMAHCAQVEQRAEAVGRLGDDYGEESDVEEDYKVTYLSHTKTKACDKEARPVVGIIDTDKVPRDPDVYVDVDYSNAPPEVNEPLYAGSWEIKLLKGQQVLDNFEIGGGPAYYMYYNRTRKVTIKVYNPPSSVTTPACMGYLAPTNPTSCTSTGLKLSSKPYNWTLHIALPWGGPGDDYMSITTGQKEGCNRCVTLCSTTPKLIVPNKEDPKADPDYQIRPGFRFVYAGYDAIANNDAPELAPIVGIVPTKNSVVVSFTKMVGSSTFAGYVARVFSETVDGEKPMYKTVTYKGNPTVVRFDGLKSNTNYTLQYQAVRPLGIYAFQKITTFKTPKN